MDVKNDLACESVGSFLFFSFIQEPSVWMIQEQSTL